MQPLIVLGLIVFFIYAFIRVLASFNTWVFSKQYRAYRQLAHRFSGRYESRGMGDPPTVSLQYHGTAVRVGLAPTIPGQQTGPRTRVVARFRSGIPFRLELAPVIRPAPTQPPKGTQAVRTGDPVFDHEFVVQANDSEMARDFLNPIVRHAIGNLQRLVHAGGMLLSINPERLLVQIDRNLGQSTEALCQAVSETLAIHDGLQLGVSRRMRQGIEIVNHRELADEDQGPPVCKVCGELIDGGPVVVCSSCRTPHHGDCWAYVGSCSIYGCGCRLGEQIAGSKT
jgi:hypothetical protein